MAIINKPTDYFNTVLYTGNGGTQSITGVGFQPDWVWVKSRTTAIDHFLTDAVRGANIKLSSNNTEAEVSQINGLTSFDSDGFSVGDRANINQNSSNFASWNWKAGTSFTNDASATGIGDIDSSGSVNTTSGFSIITATSDGAADKNIAHGLGVVPDVILAKNLASTFNWDCYFKTLGYNASLQLNSTAAPRTGAWGSATFTSTTFQTNDNFSSANGSPYIYYCFAEKQGYSKFGSYTGGSDAFVYLGFKPSFIMFKNASAVENWRTVDNKRDIDNPVVAHLYPNLSNAEGSGAAYSDYIDFLSNGFKIRSGSGEIDGSGNTIIYMAFAENPFVTSTGVPATAR
jgi:hypothetical protein